MLVELPKRVQASDEDYPSSCGERGGPPAPRETMRSASVSARDGAQTLRACCGPSPAFSCARTAPQGAEGVGRGGGWRRRGERSQKRMKQGRPFFHSMRRRPSAQQACNRILNPNPITPIASSTSKSVSKSSVTAYVEPDDVLRCLSETQLP